MYVSDSERERGSRKALKKKTFPFKNAGHLECECPYPGDRR